MLDKQGKSKLEMEIEEGKKMVRGRARKRVSGN